MESGLVQEKKKSPLGDVLLCRDWAPAHSSPSGADRSHQGIGGTSEGPYSAGLASGCLPSTSEEAFQYPPPVSEGAVDADDDAMKSQKPLAEGLVANSAPLPL